MQKYAIVPEVPGPVKNTASPLEGFTLDQCFSPDMRAVMYPCPDEVMVWWQYDGEVFSPPAQPEQPTEGELCAMRIAEIKAELVPLDAKKVRPLSAIAAGSATDDEKSILAELNAQTDALRAEMQMLELFL